MINNITLQYIRYRMIQKLMTNRLHAPEYRIKFQRVFSRVRLCYLNHGY